ncbi:MAG: DUF3996 domain-containing protein [Bradymonadales bacterium]|nr:DUF3996 domain-containing protein [Bradymonadales bacterium]
MRSRAALPASVASAILSLTLLVASLAWAGGPEGRRFGLGIFLGEPSGITAKLWLSDQNALDFLVAFDFSDEDLAFFVDYLFHFDVGVNANAFELPLYVGVGGKLTIRDDDHHRDYDDDDDIGLGVRIPIGITMLLKNAPFEFFLEIAPGLRIIPETDGDIDGGVGVRFYF